MESERPRLPGLMEVPELDVASLRRAIQLEYAEVATHPELGFHFHTGHKLAELLEYSSELLIGIPEASIESFAGTGNPFHLGAVRPGERVVDVGSGAGMDSLIAARMVGPTGRVIGVDMTREMLEKARISAVEGRFTNVEFRKGMGETLPVEDAWADVVISNGVLNLMPDKSAAFSEMARVLKPTGRLQIADIVVDKPVPPDSKQLVDLWTG